MEIVEFKKIVSSFPTGVVVMITNDGAKDYGLTINSFSSVSLEPTLILFCISKSAGSYEAFMNCKYFTANFLSSDQEEIAKKFSSKEDKFNDQDIFYTAENNVKLIKNTRAHLILEKFAISNAGDHSIVLGKAIGGYVSQKLKPLAYFDKKFFELNF